MNRKVAVSNIHRPTYLDTRCLDLHGMKYIDKDAYTGMQSTIYIECEWNNNRTICLE
jgi:hypothetical protein